jgi:hypothetical protein
MELLDHDLIIMSITFIIYVYIIREFPNSYVLIRELNKYFVSKKFTKFCIFIEFFLQFFFDKFISGLHHILVNYSMDCII